MVASHGRFSRAGLSLYRSESPHPSRKQLLLLPPVKPGPLLLPPVKLGSLAFSLLFMCHAWPCLFMCHAWPCLCCMRQAWPYPSLPSVKLCCSQTLLLPRVKLGLPLLPPVKLATNFLSSAFHGPCLAMSLLYAPGWAIPFASICEAWLFQPFLIYLDRFAPFPLVSWSNLPPHKRKTAPLRATTRSPLNFRDVPSPDV